MAPDPGVAPVPWEWQCPVGVAASPGAPALAELVLYTLAQGPAQGRLQRASGAHPARHLLGAVPLHHSCHPRGLPAPHGILSWHPPPHRAPVHSPPWSPSPMVPTGPHSNALSHGVPTNSTPWQQPLPHGPTPVMGTHHTPTPRAMLSAPQNLHTPHPQP